jgi:N-acetylmuramoyl-L-alanine amidase
MAARLEDEKYLDLLARALADGILEFLAKEM